MFWFKLAFSLFSYCKWLEILQVRFKLTRLYRRSIHAFFNRKSRQDPPLWENYVARVKVAVCPCIFHSSLKMGKTSKVVICGMKGVGKTAVLEQLIYGTVNLKSCFYPTIEDIYVANIETDRGTKERVCFYDTAGLEPPLTGEFKGLRCFIIFSFWWPPRRLLLHPNQVYLIWLTFCNYIFLQARSGKDFNVCI